MTMDRKHPAVANHQKKRLSSHPLAEARVPTVYVVGAGPGDPSLLTIKARKILACADLVAYDDLLHPEILSYTKSQCLLVPVGYRGQMHQGLKGAFDEKAVGQKDHQDQDALKPEGSTVRKQRHPLVHPAVVEGVRQGLMVVRLKCGDPMIFGRSAEEEEELRRFGIQCRYVPGITAALGAASHLGLPLTDRRYASQVTFQTATSQVQDKKTLVLYMPRKNLDTICSQLIHEGWDPKTPVVFVAGATTRAQKVARATLDHLTPLEICRTSHLPGLVVIGETAGLMLPQGHGPLETCHQKPWRSFHPKDSALQGMRILLLRATGAPSRLGAIMGKKGADVVGYPLLSEEPLLASDQDEREKKALCTLLSEASGIAFRTCLDVKMFFRRLVDLGVDLRELDPRIRFFGLKQKVVTMLQERGLRAFGSEDWGRFSSQVRGDCSKLPGETLGEGPEGDPKKILFPSAVGEKIPPGVLPSSKDGQKTTTFVATAWPCYRLRSRSFRVTAPDPHLIVLPHRRALGEFLSHVDREHALSKNSQVPGEEVLGFSWRDKPWIVFGPGLAQELKDLGVIGPVHVVTSVLEAAQEIQGFWYRDPHVTLQTPQGYPLRSQGPTPNRPGPSPRGELR